MPEVRMFSSHRRVYGHGISDTTPAREERDYAYRGPDSEPDPYEIAARVRAEVLRRLAAGEGFVSLRARRTRPGISRGTGGLDAGAGADRAAGAAAVPRGGRATQPPSPQMPGRRRGGAS
jgi:hypothetical protein